MNSQNSTSRGQKRKSSSMQTFKDQTLQDLEWVISGNKSKETPAPKQLKKIDVLPDRWCITQKSTLKFTHRWKIHNVSNHCLDKSTKVLHSSGFQVTKNLKCNLRLYPSGGHWKDCQNDVCFVLQCSPEDSMGIEFDVMFYNSHGTKIASICNNVKQLVAKKLLDCELCCIMKKRLLQPLIEDDILDIVCSFTVNNSITHRTSKDGLDNSEDLHNEWEVLNDLWNITKDKEFCDVILCIENQEFYAHRAVLAARSIFFKNMFNHCKDNTVRKFNIDNIRSSVFGDVQKFLYLGKLSNIEKTVSHLLEAADVLNLSDLKTICENYLIKNLSPKSVLQNLILAVNFNACKLKQKIKDLICVMEGQIILDDSDLKIIINMNFNLYLEILSLILRNNS